MTQQNDGWVFDFGGVDASVIAGTFSVSFGDDGDAYLGWDDGRVARFGADGEGVYRLIEWREGGNPEDVGMP